MSDELYSKYYQLGIEQVKMGDLNAARDSFEKSVAFRPNDPEATKALRMTNERLSPQAPVAAPAPVVSKSAANAAKTDNDFGLRFSIGSAPGWDESDHGVATLSMDEETGFQLEALAAQRFWNKNNPSIGAVLGGGFFIAGNSGKENEGIDPWEFDTTALGFMGQAALAGKVGDSIVIEVGPYVGLGSAITDVTTSSGLSDDGSGAYAMYGVKGGIFIKLGKSIELGIEGGYQGVSADVEVEGAPDIELTGGGARGAAVVNIKM
jgi:hypothetical protein